MNRRVLQFRRAGIALLVLAATTAGPASAKPPPDLAQSLAGLAAIDACSAQPLVIAADTEAKEELRQKGMAVPVRVCLPQFHKSLARDMRAYRLSAACGALFDVTRAGGGRLVETRCALSAGKDLPAEWRSYFETMLKAAIGRAAETYTFEAETDPSRPELREGFVKLNFDAGGGERDAMEKFERSSAQ